MNKNSIAKASTVGLLPDNIPAYLKNRKQWLLWRLEYRRGSKKPIKKPYQPNGQSAKSNNPSTWSDFEMCKRALAAGSYDGIGFAFAEGDGLTGIDLDKCYDSSGQLESWAQKIVDECIGTYIEQSPSGSGIHIFCFGTPLATGEKKWKKPGTNEDQGIEVYDHTSPRYFTVTGAVL